jgi:hypothetical protein
MRAPFVIHNVYVLIADGKDDAVFALPLAVEKLAEFFGGTHRSRPRAGWRARVSICLKRP